MTLDRRTLLELAAGGAMLGGVSASAPTGQTSDIGALSAGLLQPSATIELWPNGAPGMPAHPPVETITDRPADPLLGNRAMYHIVRPRMSVFRPQHPNGAAVLITPGGGYKYVVVDKEGYETGRWLAARGFTAFVLFYRLPGDGWAAGPNVALSDAQRGMRLIRHRAKEYGIDPGRVAALGFSAGGHVCADLLTRHDTKTYDPTDAADVLSARPVVAAPIYPVVTMSAPYAHEGSRDELIGANATAELEAAHSPDRNVHKGAPPTFLVHAGDDTTVPAENSLMLHAALRAAGVPVEMHIFTTGGHGFGIAGVKDRPAAAWPDLFVNWARTQGLH